MPDTKAGVKTATTAYQSCHYLAAASVQLPASPKGTVIGPTATSLSRSWPGGGSSRSRWIFLRRRRYPSRGLPVTVARHTGIELDDPFQGLRREPKGSRSDTTPRAHSICRFVPCSPGFRARIRQNELMSSRSLL